MKSTINSAAFIFGAIFLIMSVGQVISPAFGVMFTFPAFAFCLVVFLGTSEIDGMD